MFCFCFLRFWRQEFTMCSLLLSAISRLAWNDLQTTKPSAGILHHPLPAPSNEEGVCFKCKFKCKAHNPYLKKEKDDLSGITAKPTVGLTE